MKARYRLVQLGNRGGMYYAKDTISGSRTSLKTKNKREAETQIQALNESAAALVLMSHFHVLAGESQAVDVSNHNKDSAWLCLIPNGLGARGQNFSSPNDQRALVSHSRNCFTERANCSSWHLISPVMTVAQ